MTQKNLFSWEEGSVPEKPAGTVLGNSTELIARNEKNEKEIPRVFQKTNLFSKNVSRKDKAKMTENPRNPRDRYSFSGGYWRYTVCVSCVDILRYVEGAKGISIPSLRSLFSSWSEERFSLVLGECLRLRLIELKEDRVIPLAKKDDLITNKRSEIKCVCFFGVVL